MSEPRQADSRTSFARAEALRYGRRLTDKILIAFHDACDKGEVLAAAELLATLGQLIERAALSGMQDRREIAETLADANYRLGDVKRQTGSV